MAAPPPIAENIRSVRTAAGEPREALALAVGRTAQTVALWEAGRVTPPTDQLVQIAEHYGVTVADLVAEAHR